MFKSEFRNEQKIFQELESNVRRLISNYDSSLKELKRSFAKVDHIAEKEIDKLFSEFKSSLQKCVNDFRKSTNRDKIEYLKTIKKIEENTLNDLEKYKDDIKGQYNSGLSLLFVIKGEL